MKKSQFVTKYDYINYYVKQPSMWFFTNSEIQTAYEQQLKKLKLASKEIILDDEDEPVDDEQDVYDVYRELLEQNTAVDEDNPLITSGLIIDKKSKQFIIDYHNNKYGINFKVVDFDDKKINLLACANETKKLIEENPHVILFQPVFIDEKLKILTKCDALVKYENEIYLIETKATSSAKFHHILDLYFQKYILETNYDNTKYDINYQLCLIKYEYLDQNEVSFIISDTINLTKSVAIDSKKDFDLQTKQAIKIGASYEKDGKDGIKEVLGLNINDVLNRTDEFSMHPKVKTKNLRSPNKEWIINQMIDDFEVVINKLWAHKQNLEQQLKDMPGEFLPHPNDKSHFKTTDMWQELRQLYAAKGIKAFKYSGNILDFNQENLKNLTTAYLNHDDVMLDDYVKGIVDTKQKYISLFFNKNSVDSEINKENYDALIKCLKPKQVYFDFETINPAIRVVNNSLPFMQIVTQCSILVNHNDGMKQQCNNLMGDPAKLSINFFKEIIDNLYQGDEYSYVVYNQTFERSRLKEMIDFINDSQYTTKIQVIIDNLFDLADFFKISKDKTTVFFKELGGFYSIKKVLPLVQKYAPNIFMSTNCVDYKTLEIYNGLVCQTKSLARFYGHVNDTEWQEIEMNSKIYCENDVRAMVAVLEWVKQLV